MFVFGRGGEGGAKTKGEMDFRKRFVLKRADDDDERERERLGGN